MMNENSWGIFISEIKNRLGDNQKKAFIGTCIFGLIAHGYGMSNLFMCNDSLIAGIRDYNRTYNNMFSGVASGRLLTEFFECLNYWIATPMLSGIISILVMAITAMVVVDILDIKSNICAVLVGIVLIVYPGMVYIKAMNSIAYPIGICLFSVAAFCVIRNKNHVVGVILLLISLHIYPVYLSCYLLLLISRLVLDITGKGEVNYKLIKYSSIITIIGGMLYYITTIVVVWIMGYERSSYQGAGDAMNLTSITGSWFRKIHLVAWRWKNIFFKEMMTTPRLQFLGVVAFLLLCLIPCYLLAWQKNNSKGFVKKCIVLIGLYALLPFAVSFMTLISPSFAFHSWHLYGQAFVFVLLISYADMLFENYDKSKLVKYMYFVTQIVVVLIIYGFVLFDNIGYYNASFVMEKDAALMTRIMTRLENDKEYSYSSPVHFISIRTDDYDYGTSPFKSDERLYSIITPDSDSNLWSYGSFCYNYAYYFMGLKLAKPDAEQSTRIDEDRLKEKYKDIKSGEYYIEKIDEVYVVIYKQEIATWT